MRFSLLLLLALATPGLTGEDAEIARAYRFVGLCPAPEDDSRLIVVWHPMPEGASSEFATNVIRYLQGPDFDSCLLELLRADPNASRLLQAHVDPSTREYQEIVDAARRTWTKFGVDKAINEVGTSGKRGKRTARVLAQCRDFQMQKEDSP